LKASVAEAIRKGEREAAMAQIQSYETTIRRANEAVGSAAVQQNIDSDLPRLKDELTETFSGAPAAVEVKRKQQAKALQYDSYKARRDHN
jgi:predicted metal-dependent phosphoesterase TrpH